MTSIAAFWLRFVSLAPHLYRLDDAAALAELDLAVSDLAVSDLGDLDWEVGPHAGGDVFLALSPRCRPDVLALTKAIVAEAPDVAGWTFLPALPPKQWDGTLELGEGPLHRELHSATWRVVLHRRPAPPHAVDIRTDELAGMDASEATHAARLVLLSWLGEELFMRAVDDVRVVPAADARDYGFHVGHLRELLLKLEAVPEGRVEPGAK